MPRSACLQTLVITFSCPSSLDNNVQSPTRAQGRLKDDTGAEFDSPKLGPPPEGSLPLSPSLSKRHQYLLLSLCLSLLIFQPASQNTYFILELLQSVLSTPAFPQQTPVYTLHIQQLGLNPVFWDLGTVVLPVQELADCGSQARSRHWPTS